MQALIDQDLPYLERWGATQGAETAVVWHCRLGGYASTLIGIDNQSYERLGHIEQGPNTWAGGTLYPQASKKIAKAIYASQDKNPVIILANLSGFDGSPESLRNLQLEYGAAIGEAVVDFKGPLIFVVLSRYHGGAYVVFSKSLNPRLTSVALTGSFASVIGGTPAAGVIFQREVQQLARQLGSGDDAYDTALKTIAKKFDQIHDVQRAKKVGSIDDVIEVDDLRSQLIDRLAKEYYREY
jgi:acetyl-CoA carboxylase carboxyltransferase component